MESLFRYVSAPATCTYLPGQRASLEYEVVTRLSKAEYLQRMLDGWRRFGYMLFRPACAACSACRSVRVYADRFRPDRSQRRARRANEGVVRLEIGEPSVSDEKLRLYDRFHEHQSATIGWPSHGARDADSYLDAFVVQPFPTEEWRYYLGDRLVGVGYVDVLPSVRKPAGGTGGPLPGGLSAIYFFYNPDERQRSLGTWNVLCVIAEAARRGLPFAYLGYYVEGCRSLEYKGRFVPNQLRDPDGVWRDFRGREK
jgi:arginine-tRNA-protein transferase